MQYTPVPKVSRQGKTVNGIIWENFFKYNVGLIKIDNPITLVRRYSSKSQSLFLDCHMKLPHYHVEVTATTVGADLGPCQTSLIKFFLKKNLS